MSRATPDAARAVGTLRAVAHLARRRQWWAQVHDDRGLLHGRGIYRTRAEAIREAARMRDLYAAGVENEAQLIALRLASPLRADAGAFLTDQHGAGHLPLFVAANEPELGL